MITILPQTTMTGGSFSLCEDGKELAKCTYEASPGKGEITDLTFEENSPFNIIDAVVRAVLNSLDLRGVTTITCKKQGIFPQLQKVGFTVENGIATVDTEEFFSQPCQGHLH